MKYLLIASVVGFACCVSAATNDNAAPADELARQKQVEAEIPSAPEGYRRPKDWTPVLYKKGLLQIAKDHSEETMARAAKQMEKVNAVNAKGKYKPTGKSIDSHPCPEWFVDAKLGIFVDWGAWSIASWCPYVKGARLYPDWYEFRCRTDEKTKKYHAKNWGEDFKSDHLLDLFRGTKFDAPALMKTFKACGAKYVVPFLKHHSGFCLWDCSYTFRDTVDMSAHRDFAKEMADACRAEGLKFGFYTSQAGEWEYPILQDDGSVKIAINTPANQQPYSPDMEWTCSGKVAVKDFVHDYIVPQSTEFIDKYDPDILWNDFDWMTPATENGSYEVAAYMYNKAEGRKEVACNDRHGKAEPKEIEGRFTKKKRSWLRTMRGDFFTDEWGDTEECLDPAKWHPWESCSGISKSYGNHWMENFDASMVMSEKEFIIHFSDIVARGGNLLLLVNLDPQGAFPEIQRQRLEQIGAWLKVYGEAIYATRICAPFKTEKVDYTQSKDGKVAYAIVKEPAAEVALACDLPDTAVVTVVGSTTKLATRRIGKDLVVSIPAELAGGSLPFALKCQREDAATELAKFRTQAARRIAEIRATESIAVPDAATRYYVSARTGDDAADGRTPQTAWRTSARVAREKIAPGSFVLFERGGVYRGSVQAFPGVTYTAYGRGAKPCIYGSPANGADPTKWTRTENPNVWAYDIGHNDVGVLVFDDGAQHATKIVIRTDKKTGAKFNKFTGRPFNSYRDLDTDLHFWHDYYKDGTGKVYLHSQQNPGERFKSIEFNVKCSGFRVGGAADVTIDNFTIKYVGVHGVAAGTCRNLTVANCEFGWIGGSIQAEAIFGRDYPTRLGNAVEIYGGCENYAVTNCYMWQVYDAGVTQQFNIPEKDGEKRYDQRNVRYANNVFEKCNYSVEYFLTARKGNWSRMENFVIEDNLMFDAGVGFCEQRPDRNEGAHIKAWYHGERNRAKDYVIRRNAFCCAGDMLVQICSGLKNEDGSSSMPTMTDNVFIGRTGGQFGTISESTGKREVYGPETQTYVARFGAGNRCLFLPAK